MAECTLLIKDPLFKVSFGKENHKGGFVNSILKVTFLKEILHLNKGTLKIKEV